MTTHIEETTPIGALSYIPKIVMISLSVALICVIGISVILAVNGHSAQQIADDTNRQNQELQDELRCLRPAALAYDEALADIQLDIARGLAALAEGTVASDIGASLRNHAEDLALALKDRRQSVDDCRRP
jgi:hypothetical protein